MSSERTSLSCAGTGRDESSCPPAFRLQSDVSGQGFWEDVTEMFQNAKEEMQVGELVHLDSFNLHSAMSAIELMDPKMDIGFGQVRNVADVSLPSQLSDSQVLNIMDQLLICEMSWLDAHTLPQTVFSCVYIQSLHRVPRFELLSFLRVQLATIDSILNLVLDEKVADDEDFMTCTYGFRLRPLLAEPPEEDHVILRRILQDIDDRPLGDTQSEKSLARAISVRVHLQVELYRTIQCLSGFSFEHTLHEAPQLLKGLQGLTSEWVDCPHRRCVDNELINRVFDASINRHLMTSSPPRTAPLFDFDDALKYLQRIVTELTELVELEAFALPSETNENAPSTSRRCSLQVAMHCVASFSSNLNPTALTRSVMSRIMVPEYSSSLFTRDYADFGRLIGTDMGLTEAMMTADAMKSLGTVREGTLNIFKCLCRNRSRQRRQLLRVLRWWDHYAFMASPRSRKNDSSRSNAVVSDKRTDEGESEDGAAPDVGETREQDVGKDLTAVEALFAKKTPLQIVAYEVSARLMIQHWLLGFECDLYQEYEYAAVFFYVGYVLTTMASATTSLADRSQRGASLHPVRFALYTMDEARLWMCRALNSALEALSRGDQWNYSCGRPKNASQSGLGMFGSEELWYEQRFGVVKGMVSGPVYAEYASFLSFKKVHEESLLAKGGGSDITVLLLKDAANGFLSARRTLERAKKTTQMSSASKITDEVLQIARVAVENSLALSKLVRAYKPSLAEQTTEIKYDVNFKFSRHRHFPIIEVKPA